MEKDQFALGPSYRLRWTNYLLLNLKHSEGVDHQAPLRRRQQMVGNHGATAWADGQQHEEPLKHEAEEEAVQDGHQPRHAQDEMLHFLTKKHPFDISLPSVLDGSITSALVAPYVLSVSPHHPQVDSTLTPSTRFVPRTVMSDPSTAVVTTLVAPVEDKP
uniref:Uncharacterized protein n=1 Tax=Oryza glumipatula TaxID=40148 RepID=A0A0D9YS94_9ORYZ